MSEKKQKKLFKKDTLDTNDFHIIYETYHQKVLDFVKKRVSNKEIAEDLTGDIFEKVLKSIKDFQWQGITVSAWIFRIARNHVIDYYRKSNKRKKNKSLEEVANYVEANTPNIEVEMQADEEEVALYDGIRNLNSDDQYLVYYKFFEGLSNKEISKITGLTETNIGTRLHRVRKKLSKNIKR